MEDAAEELDSPVDDLPTSTLAVFDGATMLGFSAVHYKPAAEIVHRVHAAGAVRPTHRRQGLGTKLMQHGLTTAGSCTHCITPRSSWSSNPSTASMSTGLSPCIEPQG